MAFILELYPGAIIDVGANIGQTMMDVLSVDIDRPYFGFEPNPYCARTLHSTIMSNRLTHCVLLPIGLSDGPTVGTLCVSRLVRIDPGGSTVRTLRRPRFPLQLPIACTSLDRLQPQLDIGDVALVKIDVEGAELKVIKGMADLIRRLNPPILCEVLRRGRSDDVAKYVKRVSSLKNFLDTLDYEIFSIEKSAHGEWSLRSLSNFPLDPWSFTKWSRCDYLFLPRCEVYRFLERNKIVTEGA